MAALEIPATVVLAAILAAAAAVSTILLRAQGAPAIVWLGVLSGALLAIGGELSDGAYGVWALTIVATQAGIPAIAALLGAFLGSRIYDRRFGAVAERTQGSA